MHTPKSYQDIVIYPSTFEDTWVHSRILKHIWLSIGTPMYSPATTVQTHVGTSEWIKARLSTFEYVRTYPKIFLWISTLWNTLAKWSGNQMHLDMPQCTRSTSEHSLQTWLPTRTFEGAWHTLGTLACTQRLWNICRHMCIDWASRACCDTIRYSCK